MCGRYDVFFVENVTDIDDKIILRAHKERSTAVLAAVRLKSNAGYLFNINLI